MLVNVFTRKLFMTGVLMIVFSVLTVVGMTFVSSSVFVLVSVAMFVFVFVLVRVPGITMRVLMRVAMIMPVFVVVSMLLFFFHVYLLNRNGLICIITFFHSGRSFHACRQVRAYLFHKNFNSFVLVAVNLFSVQRSR